MRERLIELANTIRRRDERIVFCLPPRTFCRLNDEIPSIDRIAHEAASTSGFDNLILDFPVGKCMAVMFMKEQIK